MGVQEEVNTKMDFDAITYRTELVKTNTAQEKRGK
jgi:hypothetical protein